MKKQTWLLGVFMVLFLGAQMVPADDDLIERHKKWLEEEVVYIITPVEEEVFKILKSERERDLFIEAFWQQRDPTPGTEENEFKKEHYRRINYANHFHGRSQPKPGWKTDRGRIYIILGEPNDIVRYEGQSQVYATEVWFYQGLTDKGLPPGFYVVFFQEGGVGEYRLYSPLRHGPMGLMTSYWGDPMDYQAAYEQLREFAPELADVSLSLIPGERDITMGRPNMSSDLLIQKVETTPLREIKERYARKFLEYKDIVEVEYSTNYMDSDSLVKLIRDPSGIYFVHYAVEPERLSVNQYESKYYTTLKLNGTVADRNGQIIHQFEKDYSMEFDEEQLRQISHMPASIRDMFPLIPGEFKISVLLKNEVSKEFTSLERDILVPGESDGLQMTSILLGYRAERESPGENRLRPFQVGPYRLHVQPNRTFVLQDNLAVCYQVHGLSPDLRRQGIIRYDFVKNDEVSRTLTRNIGDYPDIPNFVEEFPLKDFYPAHYRLRVTLLSGDDEIIAGEEEFDLTHSEAIVRPWIYSKILSGTSDPAYAYVLGNQLFSAGKYEEARGQFERAYRISPDTMAFALGMARVDMALGKYDTIESFLLPWVDKPEPPPYEVFFTLGKAYQNLGDLEKAADIFDKAVTHHGLNTTILNTLGECYFQLGRHDEALVVWERSLEINKEQPQIRKYIEAIKEKK